MCNKIILKKILNVTLHNRVLDTDWVFAGAQPQLVSTMLASLNSNYE